MMFLIALILVLCEEFVRRVETGRIDAMMK